MAKGRQPGANNRKDRSDWVTFCTTISPSAEKYLNEQAAEGKRKNDVVNTAILLCALGVTD